MPTEISNVERDVQWHRGSLFYPWAMMWGSAKCIGGKNTPENAPSRIISDSLQKEILACSTVDICALKNRVISEPPPPPKKKGPEKWCRAKIVKKCRQWFLTLCADFWRFLPCAKIVEKCRNFSWHFLTVLDVALAAGPCCSPLIIRGMHNPFSGGVPFARFSSPPPLLFHPPPPIMLSDNPTHPETEIPLMSKFRTVSNATLTNATLVFWILNSILFSMVGEPAKSKLHSH